MVSRWTPTRNAPEFLDPDPDDPVLLVATGGRKCPSLAAALRWQMPAGWRSAALWEIWGFEWTAGGSGAVVMFVVTDAASVPSADLAYRRLRGPGRLLRVHHLIRVCEPHAYLSGLTVRVIDDQRREKEKPAQ